MRHHWLTTSLLAASAPLASAQHIPTIVLAERFVVYPMIPPPGTMGNMGIAGPTIAPDAEAAFVAGYNAPLNNALFTADDLTPRLLAWGGTRIGQTDWEIASIQPHPLYPVGDRRVLFRSTVRNFVTSATSDALLYADEGGVRAIASFQAAPGLTTLTINGGANVAAHATRVLLSNSNLGVWSGTLDSPQPLALVGAPAAGLPSPYIYRLFGTSSINASGDAGFSASYWINGDNASQGVGIYRTVGGQLELLSKSGNPAPGLPGTVFHHPTGIARINAAGQIAFAATVRNPQSGATTRSIWFAEGQDLTLIAAVGQNAPGTPAQFADIAPTTLPTIVIGDTGVVVFNARLTGPGVTPSNDTGIWVWSRTGGLRLLARKGDQIPGLPPGSTYTSEPGRFAIAINASGQIVFDWWIGYSLGDFRGLSVPILQVSTPLPANPWNLLHFNTFTTTSTWGPAASGSPSILNDGGQLTLMASAFRMASGSNTLIIRAQLPTACYANCDLSLTPPILNVADFTCFLQHFAAGDAWANCDGSTAAPILNVADFTCFLQQFAAGCQ